MSPEPVAAVTFDFWETLVRDSPDNLTRARLRRVASLTAVLARAGSPHRVDAVEDAHDRCGTEVSARYWAENREPSIREQVCLFLECLEAGLPGRCSAEILDEAVEVYGGPALEYPPELMPGAREAVQALSARGVRLGIVSNTGRTPGIVLRRILERYDLLHHFQAIGISYSDEVGWRKPDARIFRRTLEALGVEPSRALHVGDNPEDDVAGARAAGMRAVHYVVTGRTPSPVADLIVAHLGDLPGRLDGLLGRRGD